MKDESGIGYKRARDIAAHLGTLIADRPRILAMMRDVEAGLLWEEPLVTRLAAVVEAATTTCLEALDDEDEATAELYIQKVAQAAHEAWQQSAEGHNGPIVTNPTVLEIEHSSSASQDDDDGDSEYASVPHKSRLSAPQHQAQLSRLCDRTWLRRQKTTLYFKGAWQQVTRIEDLCHMHDSHKCAKETPQQSVDGIRSMPLMWITILDHQLEHGETCSTAEATRGHCACVHAVLGGLKLADPGITTHGSTIQTS